MACLTSTISPEHFPRFLATNTVLMGLQLMSQDRERLEQD